ncbi:MAG: hypothetical protein JWQ67_2375, partial [Marmoricola sp.]|nr:hypothetical protein [Marmoricola sp.]
MWGGLTGEMEEGMGLFATRTREGAPAEVAPDATDEPDVPQLATRF